MVSQKSPYQQYKFPSNSDQEISGTPTNMWN